MRNFHSIVYPLVLMLLVGCAGNPRQSETAIYEADLLAVSGDILEDIVWNAELQKVYNAATDEYREAVDLPWMRQRLKVLYTRYPQDIITVEAYEPDDANGLVAVYAYSSSVARTIHYRLLFRQSAARDFVLTRFSMLNEPVEATERQVKFTQQRVIHYDASKAAQLQQPAE